MPQQAFIPGQIAEAEGRTFRNLYPRQVRGLGVGIAGGLLGAFVFGTATPLRCAFTFGMALPGFVYGFFTPGGRPIEHWVRLWLRYQLSPRVALGVRRPAPMKEVSKREQRRWRGRH